MMILQPSPYESTKDIFSIREERITNAYRKVSIEEKVELRMIPDEETKLTEIRFWHKNRLVRIQKIKSSELKAIHL